METLVRSKLDAGYYWRKGGYEVDFVLKNKEVIPIEVKWSERIDKADYKGLLAFLRIYNLNRGFIISREIEGKIVVDDKVGEIIPILKFLLWKELRWKDSGLSDLLKL
jgi:predicted AAA+ superfamily ATPase